ncbi:MAG: FtsK/SpoIIIE domain-containing protein, partial [Anaerolineae bacterium]
RVGQIARLPEVKPNNSLEAGLTVPTELPALVRWSEAIPQRQGDLHRLVLGMRWDERGQLVPVTISLYDLFHTLVAASSGWGKSVFANALLAQLATCPEPVELVLIDQQDHGLAAFRQCDRLRYPLLRQPEEILIALQEVYDEAVGRRSELFARYDADDLADYNRRADEFLPPLVVAVDEASALLAYKEIGAELKRQAWELRKFGVYQILLLTSAKGVVIDTDHRQQFASKVQLHANERTQARLLLDAPEATTFPPGRAVVELPGMPPTIVQTPYIDKREVRALLRPALVPPPAPVPLPEPASVELSEQDKDRLFKERVEAGFSRNAASLEVYGRRYAGDLVERGKRVLGEI